ncbi:MAG TPA: hypothetical protein VFS45_02885, partial [Sphingomicrobium sp.]|nr:hypothetical protein [Sphingomicrobium sp.]
LIPKGGAEEFKAKGLDSIRSIVAAAAPHLDLSELDELADLHLLSVALDRLLHKVEKRRLFPTRLIQAAQKAAQDRVIGRLLQPGEPIRKAPLVVRLLDRFPLLRRIPGRFIGLGIRRERVRSPQAPMR